MPRAPTARRWSALRTSRSSGRARARSRARRAGPLLAPAGAPSPPPRRSRRGGASIGRPTSHGTTGTRSSGRGRGPCCRPRTPRVARRARRTKRGRSRRPAHGARGRGSGRLRRVGRTGSSPIGRRPRGPHPGLPAGSARARVAGARRGSVVLPRRRRSRRSGDLTRSQKDDPRKVVSPCWTTSATTSSVSNGSTWASRSSYQAPAIGPPTLPAVTGTSIGAPPAVEPDAVREQAIAGIATGRARLNHVIDAGTAEVVECRSSSLSDVRGTTSGG